MRSPRKNRRVRENICYSDRSPPEFVGIPMEFIGLCRNSVGLRRNYKIAGFNSLFLGVDEL